MKYEIAEKYGCTIIYGMIPVTELCAVMAKAAEGAVMSPLLAKRLGANTVFGTPAALEQLVADPDTRATSKLLTEELRGDFPLSDKAILWLEEGERGASSESMFQRFTGMPGLEEGNYPHDLSDLRRCRLLLEQVPEFNILLPQMSDVSLVWERLVERWAYICEAMDEDSPDWRNGNFVNDNWHAYHLLKTAIQGTPPPLV